jgi:quinohemoprotein ethanol dehydrogenase
MSCLRTWGGPSAAIGGIAFLLLICPTGAIFAQQPGKTDGSPVAVAMPKATWPTNGGDYYNRRFSPLTQISRANVASLKGVWRARLDGSGAHQRNSATATPIVLDGVIYVATGDDDVFAYEVLSGRRLWKYTASLDPALNSPCCGWVSRGVGYGENKVFIGQLDGKLLALDKTTGKVIWSVQAERWQDGFSITSAPLYYQGMVITGFAGADFGIRGRVKAFDAKTGKLIWTFYTIPAPGEFGSETWPSNSDAWKKGGASVWQTPALDPDLGLLYFATGNPWPAFDGSPRPGNNLFSISVLAVDVRTGKYRWHYQAVHHEMWDYDFSNPVILYDAQYNGQSRKALAVAGKTGWVYILDRVTGQPLIGIDEHPVPQEPAQATSATQPYPRGDAFVPQSIEIPPEGSTPVNSGRIFTPFLDEGVAVKPYLGGGANWSPSSIDPTTNLYYVCAYDGISVYSRKAGLGFSAIPTLGVFAAMDLLTNKVVWNQHWGEPCVSGSTTTAGGLVFVGRNDGRFTALDSSNGKKLWEFQTGAGVNAPATVFEQNGVQYVAVVSGGHLYAGSPRGDSLWLFSLNGTLGPVQPGQPIPFGAGGGGTEAPAAKQDAPVGPPDLQAGKIIYMGTCTYCHGDKGKGGHTAPAFPPTATPATIEQMLTTGKNQMPSFKGILSSQDMHNVASFVTEVLIAK